MAQRKTRSNLGPEWHIAIWALATWAGNRLGNAVDEEVGGAAGAVLGVLAGAMLSWIIEQAG